MKVRYWHSRFFGHTGAHNDLLSGFSSATEKLDPTKFIQISMDGPAVNHKFYDSLKKQREENELPKMIDIGGCNLHIVHDSFKTGIESTDWEVKKLLKNNYQLLHAGVILETEGNIQKI